MSRFTGTGGRDSGGRLPPESASQQVDYRRGHGCSGTLDDPLRIHSGLPGTLVTSGNPVNLNSGRPATTRERKQPMNANRNGTITAVRAQWSRSAATRALRIQLGVAVLAAVLVAGCSSSTGSNPLHGAWGSPVPATPTADAPAPAAAAVTDVPWAKVGPGWTLAMWNPATGHGPGDVTPGEWTANTLTTTLYLIDPAGARYAITTFPPVGNGPSPRLVDWSGDGSHALFDVGDKHGPHVISVDLHTGTHTTLTVDGTPRYTRPDGRALLVSTSGNGTNTLKRIDLAGNPQFTYPTDQLGDAGQFGGAYVESPDGTQLVLSTANPGTQQAPMRNNSLVVLRNDGVVVRELPSPMPGGTCHPERWWTSTVILADCTADSGSQLWQVPLDGEAPTALTAVNSGHGDDAGFRGDFGDSDAWQLPSGTFLQSAGACGSIFLSRLTPDKHTTRVTPPGLDSSVLVAGATADKLLLVGKVGCGDTTSLVAYDPATNTDTVLLGPPVTGGSVIEVLPYSGQK
jgi:hypothetical protein